MKITEVMKNNEFYEKNSFDITLKKLIENYTPDNIISTISDIIADESYLGLNAMHNILNNLAKDYYQMRVDGKLDMGLYHVYMTNTQKSIGVIEKKMHSMCKTKNYHAKDLVRTRIIKDL